MSPSSHPKTSLRSSPKALGALLAVVVVAAIGLGVWWWSRPKPADWRVASADAGIPEVAAVAVPVADGGLNETPTVDPTSLRAVSRNPDFQRWLGEDDVMSRLMAALVQVSDGESPVGLLQFMRPEGGFEVKERGRRLIIDPASFARYDALSQAIHSVDPEMASAVYRSMHPALSRLHAQVAPPGVTLDASVAGALRHLLDTPTPPREIAVERGPGITYVYANPALEERSGMQKHFMRMGAKNVRRIKAKLRAMEEALAAATPSP